MMHKNNVNGKENVFYSISLSNINGSSKSCLKISDKSPLGKFLKCIDKKEAEKNATKRKHVRFADLVKG